MAVPDFSGYATKNDLRCTDGLTIRRDAFKVNDGQQVPVFWQHSHNDPANVIGHAILSNRPDGVYAKGYFNDTPRASYVKSAIRHGDIRAMSIHATDVRKRGADVLHGDIAEVSIVYKGANPGALIENVSFTHSDSDDWEDGEIILYSGIEFEHSGEEPEKQKQDESKEKPSDDSKEEKDQGADMADDNKTEEMTVEEKFNSLDDDTKNLIYYLVGAAIEDESDNNDDTDDDDQKGDSVSHNIFENQGPVVESNTLTHAQLEEVFADAHRPGMTLKDSILYHADQYGITNIDLLFPDAKVVGDQVQKFDRRSEWVKTVLAGTNHSPFAKVKTTIADLTPDTARAKGYIKGNFKKEEFFALIKRETTPTTIYKKQKLDRDDVTDITDLDTVAFLKEEMREKLDEELARAILIGDGRAVDDEDHIADPFGSSSGKGIRSIYNDDNFYAHNTLISSSVTGDALVDTLTRAMDDYRGTGTPTLFTSRKNLTDMLLVKDVNGRRIYPTMSELTSVLQVKEIVPVEVFDQVSNLFGIVVNLRDYTIGTNKGGEVSFFDDFDIDYNQMKYLYETRLSGGLTMPKSALVIRYSDVPGNKVPVSVIAPTQIGNNIYVPMPSSNAGYDYRIEASNEEVNGDELLLDASKPEITVQASARPGYTLISSDGRNTSTINFTYHKE